MIKRIASSKGIVTAVWVLGLVVIWEICAFIVGATQLSRVTWFTLCASTWFTCYQ